VRLFARRARRGCGCQNDVALVDALLTADRFVGSRGLFDPALLRMCVQVELQLSKSVLIPIRI